MLNPFRLFRRSGKKSRIRPVMLAVFVAAFAFNRYSDMKRPTEIGLEGYCPVTLQHEGRWQTGVPKYDASYEDRLYYFSSEKERELFETNPERYAPVESGIDVVRLKDEKLAVPGKRKHGVVFQERVYLFDSETTLEKFWADADRYAAITRNVNRR